MKNRRLKYLIGRSIEVMAMLLLVLLFFALLTTLLFSIFPSGISLTQIIEQRNGINRDTNGGRSHRGAVFDETTEPAAATLSQTENDVKSKGSSSIAWGTARQGMTLYDHDAIQTFRESSAQINFDSRNYLTMGSNSLVIIKKIEKDRSLNQRRSVMVIVDGDLQGHIASNGQNPLLLEISTPSAVAKMLPGVSSNPKTDFKISINPDQSSTIVVYNGQAEVSAQGRTVRVSENSGVTVKQGQAPRSATQLHAPPSQTSPSDRSTIRYRELTPRVRFNWSGGKGNDAYHLQVAKDNTFKEMLVDKRIAGTEFVHGNLKKGIYFWRISSIEEGREGRMSKTIQFELVQELAPPTLQVTFPSGPVLEERFVVVGSTNPGNRIFVAGNQVPTDTGGAFSCEVPIKPGMNLVTVEAVDETGNVTYRSHYVQGRF